MTTFFDSIKFDFNRSNNQNDLFTKDHVKFRCVIKYKGKQYSFDYQCNYKDVPTLKDCMYCLLSDASFTDYDVDEFLKEMGYTHSLVEVRMGEKAYKGCVKTAKALQRIFTESELAELNEAFENY